MKGKTNGQKGITLIALIITIVVLLILAAVAISSIQNDGILHYAQNAADNWNKASANEANIIGDYLNYLNNIGSGEDDVATVTPKVGQYVEYDVSYDDMYNSTNSVTKTFGKTDGWRYLGTEKETGNHLLISTGIPAISNYDWTTVVDYFKITGKTYSNSITVRTLTLAELNRAVNSANAGVEDYTQRAETSIEPGFKGIPEGNPAYGLFDLADIGFTGYSWFYWLGSDCLAHYDRDDIVVADENPDFFTRENFDGDRLVIVLPSNMQFTDSNNDTVLEIKEN